VAVDAARQAARVIQASAGRLGRDDVRTKGRHDLVTDIDVEAQRVVVEVLKAAFPDHGVLAEEGDAAAGPEAARGYRWIIDPIDGTTNFTRGVPPYAVSVALQHGAQVVVGVVLDVARDELFTAVRGGGLFVDGAPAHVSRLPSLDESLVTTGFPYRSVDGGPGVCAGPARRRWTWRTWRAAGSTGSSRPACAPGTWRPGSCSSRKAGAV
jgi:myo-inositol-1(or 4)-monophosphatase